MTSLKEARGMTRKQESIKNNFHGKRLINSQLQQLTPGKSRALGAENVTRKTRVGKLTLAWVRWDIRIGSVKLQISLRRSPL